MNPTFFLILLLIFSPVTAVAGPSSAAPLGTISGQLVDSQGEPITVGVVSFFNTNDGLPFDKGVVRRIPNHVVRLDASGTFKAELPAGFYYLGALQRARGVGPGPPRPGEKFFFILNSDESMASLEVKAGQHQKTGQISGAVPDIFFSQNSFFSVEGTLRHDDGRPFANAFVTVKRNLDSLRPLFISSPSSSDGRYLVKLPPGKGYYLMAVQDIQGGRPQLGSYIGSYGGQSPNDIPGKDTSMPPLSTGRKSVFITGETISGEAGGSIVGIDITLYKMLDPAEIRKRKLKEAKAQQPFALEQIPAKQ